MIYNIPLPLFFLMFGALFAIFYSLFVFVKFKDRINKSDSPVGIIMAIIAFLLFNFALFTSGVFDHSNEPKFQQLIYIAYIPLVYMFTYSILVHMNKLNSARTGDMLTIIDLGIISAFSHQAILAGASGGEIWGACFYFFPAMFAAKQFFNKEDSFGLDGVVFFVVALTIMIFLEHRVYIEGAIPKKIYWFYGVTVAAVFIGPAVVFALDNYTSKPKS